MAHHDKRKQFGNREKGIWGMGRQVNHYALIVFFAFCTPAFAGQLVTGNLGVSTTSARQTLDVQGAVYVTGNVGLGTLNPGQKIDVQGTVRATGFIASGNVGISTTCPAGTNWRFDKGILTGCN